MALAFWDGLDGLIPKKFMDDSNISREVLLTTLTIFEWN